MWVLLISHVNPSQCHKVVLILHVKKLLFVLSRARIGCTLLFGNQQMSDVKLILRLKVVLDVQKQNKLLLPNHKKSIKYHITSFPARIPHVSTLLIVLELANEINSTKRAAGSTTVLNPDGPKNIVRGLRFRSNPGISLQLNQEKMD